MTSITDFLLDAANANANAEPGAYGAYLFGYDRLNEGPLCRMMRAETPMPRSEHYDSLAVGLHALLGQVDENLIQTAMAEKAAGVTLH